LQVVVIPDLTNIQIMYKEIVRLKISFSALIYQVLGPKVWPGARTFTGVPALSAPTNGTVFPHQTRMLVSPIVPFFGNCKAKKMTKIDTANPESSAAART